MEINLAFVDEQKAFDRVIYIGPSRTNGNFPDTSLMSLRLRAK